MSPSHAYSGRDDIDKDKFDKNDFRKLLPGFSGEHWKNNNGLVKACAEIASGNNCTPAQLALSWLLNRGNLIIPIPGTRHRKYPEENAAAADVVLSDDDMRKIDSLLTRFPDIGSHTAKILPVRLTSNNKNNYFYPFKRYV